MKIKVINGPNLNMLGIREPDVYGTQSFEELCRQIRQYGTDRHHEITLFQSNSEGEIIDQLQQAYLVEGCDGVIINPGAYTHYSYAIHDAIKALGINTVEVHLSPIHKREAFRKRSVIAPACIGQLSGFGETGYLLAIIALEKKTKPLEKEEDI